MAWAQGQRPRQRGVPQAMRRRVMREHVGVCHYCGHPDATDVDHIINYKRWLQDALPGSPDQYSNLAPIHAGNCPHCGRRCHKDKTQLEATLGRMRLSPKRPEEPHPGRL